ncbi:MAG: DUF4422 domain-containing protein [Romboutsia sp.]|uniref:DUF4422 domain-containing protein n=1 Tax=Romboutsia sp. TaxID=1965302 RepID=UPI003F4085DC
MDNKNFKNEIPMSIYVIHHKPYLQLISDVFKPISPKDYGLNILSADTGDNMADENDLYAEYTTFYWALKNDLEAKYLAFFHYRRYLCFQKEIEPSENPLDTLKWDYESLEKLMDEYDLVLPPRMDFTNVNLNIYGQFRVCHGTYILDRAIEVISQKYPKYIESLNTVINRSYGYFCNLFITKREIFEDYMNFAFGVFDELKVYLPPNYEGRLFALLGERLFSIYIEYLRTNTDIRMCEVPLVFIENKGSNYNVKITPVLNDL